MRPTFLVLVLLLSLGVALDAEEPPASKPKVADLAWLAGSWLSSEGGTRWEEHWLPPAGDSLAAVTRMVKGDKTGLYELSVIEQEADGIHLRLRHFHRSLVPWASEAKGPLHWKLKTHKDRKATFENPEQDFPRRIVYHRVEDNLLQVTLEGQQGGTPRAMRFDLRRAN